MTLDFYTLRDAWLQLEKLLGEVVRKKSGQFKRFFDTVGPKVVATKERFGDFVICLVVPIAAWFGAGRETVVASVKRLGILVVMQVPNTFSLVRIYLADLVFYSQPETAWVLFYPTIVLVGVITDYLDGELARRIGAVSNLGKWLDPICDKVLAAAAIYAFWDYFWLWTLIPCIAFEAFLLLLGLLAYLTALILKLLKRSVPQKVALGSNRLGMWKYNAQGAVLLSFNFGWVTFGNSVLVLADLLALGSIYRHLRPHT